MEAWELLEETKWQILEEISQGPVPMAEIAKRTATTTANVSQHLKVLDAYGFVRKEKENSGRPGKPRTLYSLNNSIAFIGLANPQMAGRATVGPDEKYQSIILRTLLATTPKDNYYVLKLVFTDVFLKACESLAFLKSDKEKLELFAVAKDVEKFRENYSNFTMEKDGEEREVACWSHSEEEVSQGLEEGDRHYRELVENSKVLYDPKDNFARWKK